MTNIDYIEEIGQHYYQCIIEVRRMNLVTFSTSYDRNRFYIIMHSEIGLDPLPKGFKVYRTVTKHKFKYSIN